MRAALRQGPKKVKCIDNATFDTHLDFQNPNSEVR